MTGREPVGCGLTVKVYSTGPHCQQCRLTCERLTARGVWFEVVDITDEAHIEDRIFVTQRLGYTQAPVVVVKGGHDLHWSGFDPVRIDELAAQSAGSVRS